MKILVSICILFSLFLFAAPYVFAQDSNSSTTSGSVVSPTPTPIDYQMPYPGILPDSPLYKFKTLRDRIVSFLISDPIKKGEFNLLTSDKRIGAAQMLYNGHVKDTQLISDTVSKGENYFSEALTQVHFAKKQGANTNDLLHRMFLSNKKHLEIIDAMEIYAPASLGKSLARDEDRIKQMGNIVESLINKH